MVNLKEDMWMLWSVFTILQIVLAFLFYSAHRVQRVPQMNLVKGVVREDERDTP